MEIRDPVHGSIQINDEEIDIIEHPFFRRLRGIKQLGFSEYVFPGATHTRYLHSIGVMHISSKVFIKLFEDKLQQPKIQTLHETVRLACLLHDIGHAPLSHTTECVMPMLSELKLPKNFQEKEDRQATHEDYTIKSITDSSFSSSFLKVKEKYKVNRTQVAELIIGYTNHEEYFTFEGINYFPLLHQLVSSEMDCDRMDYLLRDSYFCGVSYGKFDLDWIIDNLHIANKSQTAFLAISERAIATFDDFLLSRFHMFLMVYFHYKSVALEKLLRRYFKSNEYSIPADIEEYLHHDDHHLLKTLKKSNNQWAKRVIENDIPEKVFEAFGATEQDKAQKIQDFFETENIDYIVCSSSGRLSKYYQESRPQTLYPIQVARKNSIFNKEYSYIDIHEATDLFDKFKKAHTVIRIHTDIKDLTVDQKEKLSVIINEPR
jgi:hypothetical protein